MRVTMTVWGIFNWDPQKFKNSFHIPSALNIDRLCDNLVTELAPLEILYPDPDMFTALLDSWSSTHLPNWEHLEETFHYDYNPIHNYDRTEEISQTETRNLENTDHYTDNTTGNGNTEMGGSDVTHHKTRAMNTPGLTETTQDSTDYGGTSTNSNSQDVSHNGNGTHSGTIGNTATNHMYGNIGVTTTQQMIEEERRIAKYNLYDEIIQEFKTRFCILVY